MTKTTNTYETPKIGGASSEDPQSKQVRISGPPLQSARLVKKADTKHATALIEGNDEAGVDSRKNEHDGVHVVDSDVSEAQAQAEQVLHSDIEPQVKDKPSKRVFRFMELPRELRNVVYDEVWKDTPHIKAPHLDFGIGTTVRYDHLIGGDQHLEGLPTWLLTSKQMFEEGLVQFRLKAQWSFNSFHWVQLCDVKVSHGIGEYVRFKKVATYDLWRELRKDTSKTSPYLHPSMAHDIIFENWKLSEEETCELIEESVPGFAPVAQLLNNSPNLKTLRLPVAVSYLGSVYPTKVDLSLFDTLNLPQLQTFEFVIFSDVDEVEIISTAMKQFGVLQVFEAEVLRVGQLLVGSEGRLSIVDEKPELHSKVEHGEVEDPTERTRICWTFKYTTVGN
jgi:hypothetical protein